MALSPGDRLGPYEVLAPLGAGGMGEVYRARDLRLAREVAIKVLPPDFSRDPERLHRFEQEARAAAALNHPDILAVYDIGQHNASPYIVSELLEGGTLRARLGARALPARKAVDYAIQIARGLTAAHAKGIVHRDLKPENIFITSDERVKILDFGVAKLADRDGKSSANDLPTRAPETHPGLVLGTIGYMSPEQVRGQPADHRSDIFAFGAILYEMVTGRRAFDAQSNADTMTAILQNDPAPLAGTDLHIAPGLVRIVDRCLEKSPNARFQSTDDLRFALEGLSTRSDASAAAPTSQWRRATRLPWAGVAAATLPLVVMSALVVSYYGRPQQASHPVRFLLSPPGAVTFSQTAIANFLAVSPDGRQIAFAATNAAGTPLIWVRAIDSLEARPLQGTEGGRLPFWSPDNRHIGFFAHGFLKKLPASGGPPQVLCEANVVPTGGAWSREDVILFSGLAGPIRRVSSAGGESVAATTPDSTRQDTRHSFPQFLPDGRRFLYFLQNLHPEYNGIYVQALDSKEGRLVLRASSNAMYVEPGYLLYARDGVLMAQAFDAGRATTSGDPVPVAGSVDQFPESGVAAFSSSETGVLVYRGSPEPPASRLRWLDRSGTRVGELGEPRPYRNPRLSPDGKRVAVEIVDRSGNRDIWLIDVARSVPVRFTFDPGRDAAPVWSPDGQKIAWQGNLAMYMKPSSGMGREETLRDEAWIPDDWLPDGSGLLCHPNAPRQVSLVSLTAGDRTPRPVVEGRVITTHARVSPDGRWVAFANTDSGRFEVYVQNFPTPAGRWQVSVDGGLQPKWRGDGKELFYLAMDGMLMAVPLSLGVLAEVGKPEPLFQTRIEATTGFTWHQYDVSPDGRRFLVNTPEISTTALTVVVNWPALLKP
jgi:Tol biopolymer transport system component